MCVIDPADLQRPRPLYAVIVTAFRLAGRRVRHSLRGLEATKYGARITASPGAMVATFGVADKALMGKNMHVYVTV